MTIEEQVRILKEKKKEEERKLRDRSKIDNTLIWNVYFNLFNKEMDEEDREDLLLEFDLLIKKIKEQYIIKTKNILEEEQIIKQIDEITNKEIEEFYLFERNYWDFRMTNKI